jgi:hypothetical protein
MDRKARQQWRWAFMTAAITGLVACGGSGGAPGAAYPVIARAEQAPEVRVQEIVERDDWVGRRVRVTGTCGLAGTGPSTGVWVLEPPSCFRGGGGRAVLTIFAQVEPKAPDSEERLLLRLPE